MKNKTHYRVFLFINYIIYNVSSLKNEKEKRNCWDFKKYL